MLRSSMNDVSEITIQSSIVFHDSTVRNENSKLTDIVKTTDLEIQVSIFVATRNYRYFSKIGSPLSMIVSRVLGARYKVRDRCLKQYFGNWRMRAVSRFIGCLTR